MDEEYKRDLQRIIRIWTNEIISVYCSSDGKFSVTKYFHRPDTTIETEVVE